MENPKDETAEDNLAPPADDEDEQEHAEADPKPVPPDDAKKKPKGAGPGEEDSYEDGWYQVLKRRAGEAGNQEE